MSQYRSHGLTALVWRQLATGRWAAVTLVAVVLVLSFCATASPRVLEQLIGRDTSHSVALLPDTARDLSTVLYDSPPIGPSPSGDPAFPASIDEVWGSFDAALAEEQQAMPTEVRGATSAARYGAVMSPLITGGPLAPTDPVGRVSFLGDPRMADVITLASGSWPGPIDPAIDPAGGDSDQPIDIVLSEAAATTMGWAIGTTRPVELSPNGQTPVRLTGTFRATDSDDPYWQRFPSVLEADVFDNGNTRPIATAGAYVDPASWAELAELAAARPSNQIQTRIWYPFDAAAVTGANAGQMEAELRQTSAVVVTLGSSAIDGQQLKVRFTTETTDVLEASLDRAGASSSILVMTAIGPFGVAIAVLALAARLIAQRRRRTLSIVAARGGSRGQLLGMLMLEGAIIGVPAAIIGAAIAIAAIPATTPASAFVLPAIVAVLPAVLLSTAASRTGLRQERADLGDVRPGRRRWILEAVVVLLTVIGTGLLLVRGVGSTGAGVDPLLVATPLLLMLSACIVVLHVYPLPLAGMIARLRPTTSVTGFVGAVRSRRSPAAGLAPVLALVVAVSVAVFSSVMLASLRGGVETAAEARIGGDVRASGPVFTTDLATTIAALDGVAGAVTMQDTGTQQLQMGDYDEQTTVILVDTVALAAQQAGLADALPGGLGLDRMVGDTVPIVMSSDLAARRGSASPMVNGQAVTVVADQQHIAGSANGANWVLGDVKFVDQLVTGGFNPRIVLIEAVPGADLDTLAGEVRAAAAGGASVSTITSVAEQIRSAPIVNGLQAALLVLLGIVGALCALALILVSAINAPERSRLAAILRTLGLVSRRVRGLAVWELGPVVVTAFVVGTALGLLLPPVIWASLDLRPFTGGAVQPPIIIDPVLTLALLGGFLLLVAISLATTLIGSRRPIAQTMRTGEE